MTTREYIKEAEAKRSQLIKSLKVGEIADPITMMIVSIGISVGTSALSSALQPKGSMQQVGLMKGTVQLQNSKQGQFIPEIYGGAPVVSLEPGVATNWTSQVNMDFGANGKASKNTTSGVDQNWNAGAVHSATVADADDAFIRFTVSGADAPSATFAAVGVGFSLDNSPESGAGVGGSPAFEFGVVVGTNVTGTDASSNPIVSRVFHAVINGVAGLDLGNWNDGDEFRLEKRSGVFHLYHDFAEVTTTPPVPSATLYLSVSGWRSGYGVTTSFVKIGDIGLPPSAGSGGCKVPAMTVWAVPPLKHSYITNTPTHGGKGHPSTPVENIFYTIDWRLNFARGPLTLIREYGNTDILIHQDPNLQQPSGVYNPATEASVYDPATPPDPAQGDDIGFLLGDGSLDVDGAGVGTGTIQQSGSGIAVYPGNETQGVDPTEEAAIDLQNGPNSTPAHRGVAGIVHTGLNLQRWQNVPPNTTAVWQHQTLKTLGPIFASLCQRPVDKDGVPLLTTDDFNTSSIDAVICRGMLLDGRRFAPQEIFDNEEIQDFYNYFTTEGEGKIVFYLNGDEPSITIPETDIGWLDGAATLGEVALTVSVSLEAETKKPKQVDLKYINPGADWEDDTQSTQRKVTDGNAMESLSVQVTGNPDEARAATERRLYRKYVGDLVRFTLSWQYLYLYAGYKITTTDTSAGITYVIRLTSRIGGIGVQDCEGILLEVSSFSQASVGSGNPLYNPAHPKPAVTILAAIDLPTFRPQDEGKFGMYFACCPRSTELQTWNGAALFIKRGGTWIKLDEFPASAIMGRIAVVTGTLGTDPEATDATSIITVDLYGTKAILESVTEANMIAGLNRVVFGSTFGGFATATRLANFPNRWELSILRNGQNNTEAGVSSIAVGQSFVLLNQAVRFIELDIARDLNTTLFVKAVSFGQSLTDAAQLEIVSTGRSLVRLKPSDFVGFFDSQSGNLLLEWSAPDLNTESVFELEITDGAGRLETIKPDLTRHLQEYVIWDVDSFIGTGPPTFPEDGSVTLPDGHISSSASAEIVGGFLVEFQIPLRSSLPATTMSIYPEGSTGTSTDDDLIWSTGGTFPNYTATPEHDFSDSTSPFLDITPGDRLGIFIRPDGIGEYHLNYSPHAKPIWISSRKIDITKKFKVFIGGPGTAIKVSWQRQGPEYLYLASAQRLDNSLLITDPLPTVINARVRQLALVAGTPASGWLEEVFTRP